jgi:hypothetical protein
VCSVHQISDFQIGLLIFVQLWVFAFPTTESNCSTDYIGEFSGATGGTVDTRDRIKFMEATMERLLRTNNGADAKVATLVGMNTTMLAVLAALVTRQQHLSFFLVAIAAASAVGLLFGLFFLSLSSLPRTSRPAKSVVFFGAISAVDPATFASRVKSVTDDEYLDDLIDQCYRTSSIASKKFRWIRRAQMAWYISIVPWLWTVYALYQP